MPWGPVDLLRPEPEISLKRHQKSVCGREVHICSTCSFDMKVVDDAGVAVQGCPIHARPEKNLVIYLNYQNDVQVCSQGAWNNLKIAPNLIENLSPDRNFNCSSRVSRPQKGCLQVLTWPSDQYMANTGTKTKTAFIGEHNASMDRFSA
ncbi:uncharacterized protein TNCV_4185021 [Trichonephila clavipes]|nr:uncharacterized protein TNCV_4185021 [Trichonephila clavipes]